MPSHTKVANGNIAPARFVKLDSTADGKVLQADAGAKVYGVSQMGTRRTPYASLDDGYAAIAGEELEIFGPGENSKCQLELGGTVSPGDYLKSDANGKGVATTTDKDAYGAVAMQAGTSGQLVEVEVRTGYLSV